ncbi:Rrf2 family transcriptional regulator [Psychroflexus sp. YR1-1]|uniref:Rrf2 family transcriptional regulator n=1 Tax=Psychroflexus aurantiacus TaxID=2709310 RepID=A0A6B3R111_9FLAO|nr:Rrf2 family transcriptional regulator [Psychroflexus aurantiacus]NEV93708.1 Rrf2 family transcriptional regulator [Psychroflexus aurantiacus]
MFSKRCEYAIKIMTFIAHQQKKSNKKVDVDAISKAIDSPKAFTAKILQDLVKSDLLVSTRGRFGGFSLSAQIDINLKQIIEAIDGHKLLEGCLLGFGACSEKNPCVVHHQLKSAREILKLKLRDTNLEIIAKRVNEKNAYFKE